MKKIIIPFFALAICVGASAQVIKVYNGETLVKKYSSEEATNVKYTGNATKIYKGETLVKEYGDAECNKVVFSDVAMDTLFSYPGYTTEFINNLYMKYQYYGLLTNNGYNGGDAWTHPHSSNPYAGKLDALTDCWHQFWNGTDVNTQYYAGNLSADVTRADGLSGPLYSYNKEYQWWMMSSIFTFLNRATVEESGLEASVLARLKAEARCLMVDAFFNTFQHYGGIPIMTSATVADINAYQAKRNTVEECVNWMVEQLDMAIKDPDFPWNQEDKYYPQPGSTSWISNVPIHRWTRAGAMSLKCKILQFAASPLLNPKDGKPYYDGAADEVLPYIMYTDASKYQERWNDFAKACDEFYNALEENGQYSLVQANIPSTATTVAAKVPYYRLAYRKGYFLTSSTEILFGVNVFGNDPFTTARYCWHSWYTKAIPRNAYSPTQEYVEKFSWNDGEPFNWENAAKKTYKNKATEPEYSDEEQTTVTNFITNSKTGAITRNAKSLHRMFVTGSIPSGGRQINTQLTRDPRLYEECIVNGENKNLDWSTASMSGYPWELWYNGYDGGTGMQTQSSTMFGSGYGFNKYYLGDGTTTSGDSYRYPTQWVTLSLPEFYLQYAEALVMRSEKDVTKAVEMVDLVRSRVGLPTMAKVWANATWRTAKGYTAETADNAMSTSVTLSNGQTSTEFMEELLDERVRELGLTNARWFDMIRLKRTDWMTKQLHGLLQYRVEQNGTAFQRRDVAWVGSDYEYDATSTQPLDFLNLVKPITGNKRVLWEKDPASTEVTKWLLSPLPASEISKGYGLIQNPGW